jgi:hypothetical protein
MYPLLFALLPGKIQAVYAQLLTKLQMTMADLQLFMNFETAAQKPLELFSQGLSSMVEVVPYLLVTVDPLGCNIVRECSCVGRCINVV